MIRPGDRDAVLFNDEVFSQLRRAAGVPDDFVNKGWSLETLESGDAKSGCLMAFLGSDFVVKELNSDDHESLLRISQSYLEHVLDGDTLLAAIFLHFEDAPSGRRFYAMRNVLGSGPFLAMYDLKGCNDDKTVELFGNRIKAASTLLSNAGRWCGYMGAQYWYDYQQFNAGKVAASKADLVVTKSQRENVLRRMRRDTEWLVQHQLMDYSLLVGMKTGPADFASSSRLGQSALVRRCADGSDMAVCIGIIDFLQVWNLKKIAARAIKCMECNKATIPPAAYAVRFCEYFEHRFASSAKDRLMKVPACSVEVEDDQSEALVLSHDSMRCSASEDRVVLQTAPDAAIIGAC
jgi:hypothetical protein